MRLKSIKRSIKWMRSKPDLQKGDIVLVAESNIPRGQWPLGRIVEINVGRDGDVRSCVIRTRTSQIVRPITKLCMLENSN